MHKKREFQAAPVTDDVVHIIQQITGESADGAATSRMIQELQSNQQLRQAVMPVLLQLHGRDADPWSGGDGERILLVFT